MPELAVSFEPALPQDADALVELRIAAMRPSLEHLGRFDPQRARDRFLASFQPLCTRHLVVDGVRVGFMVVREQDDHLLLDHLYVHPSHQARGIGGTVLRDLFQDADARGLPIRVGALRQSDSNRFYRRHGFVLVEEGEWDNYYVRAPVCGRAKG